MKNQVSNRVNMINASIIYCDANAAATAMIALFITVLGLVKSKMVLVNSLNIIAGGTSKGVTLDTNAIRKAMTVIALKCANATIAYANATENSTLAALVNFSETKLNRMKKEDIDDICEAIHNATDANFAAVAGYGLIPDDLTDLAAAIALYRISSQNPRQAIITKSEAIRQMETMVADVVDNLLVKQLDKMVNTLKPSNYDFWSGYQQAREVIDLGSTTAKIRGVVLNENDVPLIGVEFKIVKAGTDELVGKVLTDVKGKFNIAKLPAGMVDLRWRFSGYKDVLEPNVKISAGKELKRKIVMEAGTVVVREGSFGIGMIANVVVPAGANDDTWVTVEVIGTDVQNFAADSASGEQTGSGALYANNGVPLTMKWSQVVAQIGLNAAHPFYNVKNVGGSAGSWRVTFVLA